MTKRHEDCLQIGSVVVDGEEIRLTQTSQPDATWPAMLLKMMKEPASL
jgi:hypothetical protein